MDLTANTRYDVGFYIATDNDPNHDGALTGQCTATASLAGNTSNFIELDPGADVCGEISGPLGAAHNPLFVTATISMPSAPPGGQMELPFAYDLAAAGVERTMRGYRQRDDDQRCVPGVAVEVQRRTPGPRIFAGP